MKTRLLITALIIWSVFAISGTCYATELDPIAVLTADMDFGVTAGSITVTFDGSASYDPGGSGGLDDSGIYEFVWDFGDGHIYSETATDHPDGKFDGIHAHTYTSASTGVYEVTLTVYDVSENTEDDSYDVGVKNTIQDAIDAASDDDIVVVAPGTYTGPGNCDLDFLGGNPPEDPGKAITVRSIDPNDPVVVATTIIDCYYDAEVYARGFCFDNDEGADSIVAGFTIINGWHDDDLGTDDNLGGAIYCKDASPTITNCVFTDNAAPSGGGAIYCEGSSSAPKITGCIFSSNKAWNWWSGASGSSGGAIYCKDCSPAITGCTFEDNYALVSGGGIYAKGSTSEPTVTNCLFSNNKANDGGGGMCCDDASGTITDCNFVGNYSDEYGGGFSVFETNGAANPAPALTGCFFSWNRAGQFGGGMDIYLSFPTVVNCVFSQNYASFDGVGSYAGAGAGVGNWHSSSEFVNCTFHGNVAYGGATGTGYGGGMYHKETTNDVASIINCIFWGNIDEGDHEDESAQIYVHPSTDPPNPVENSCIQDDDPDDASIPYQTGTEENIDDDPLFVNADDPDGLDGVFRTYDDGLFLGIGGEEDSPCIDAGQTGGDVPDEDITGFDRIAGEEDMGAYEGRSILFVDGSATAGNDDGTSWANAFVYLQDALTEAETSDVNEIWVAAGTYYPDEDSANPSGTGSESATFALEDGVAIYGGFVGDESGHCERDDWATNETILSGDLGGGYNSLHVVTGTFVTNSTILDGLTISGGDADTGYGGGITFFIASVTLRNCTIADNVAKYGGGVRNYYNSHANYINCVFSGNSADDSGGAIYCYNSSPRFVGCLFEDNQADDTGGGGGAVLNTNGGTPMFTSCIFSGNKAGLDSPENDYGCGGAIFNSNTSPIISNCIFSGNDAGLTYYDVSPYEGYYGYGGAICNWYGSSPTLTNCVFTGNDAGIGGGVYNYASDSNPILTNCTFSGNSAGETDGTGGGMHNESSSPILVNCILWGNTAGNGLEDGPEIYNASGDPLISYCDIKGCGGSDDWDTDFGTDQGGNIDIDPLFVNANDPDGSDGEFFTPDDGLKLLLLSPCTDAADGYAAESTDVCGNPRLDIEYMPNTGTGLRDYADIGAYEYGYDISPGYITSFEDCQGYTGSSIYGVDGWEIKQGDAADAAVNQAQYKYGSGGDDCYPYQYVTLAESSDTTVSYDIGEACEKSCVRISCIPSPGSYINVLSGSSIVASIKFDSSDSKTYVLDNGTYQDVSLPDDYDDIADQCRLFLKYPSTYYTDEDYSYENTWMEFKIEFDWENHQYSVSWVYCDPDEGGSVSGSYTEIDFDASYDSYTNVEIQAGTTTDFELNRMSISDASSAGGVVGAEDDAWLVYPVADILNPLKGQIALIGNMWYDSLGQYVIKACPADLDPNDTDNWTQVCVGSSVSQEVILLGYWNAETFYNGDYFLKIEIYDDIGRKLDQDIDEDDDEDEEFIWADIEVNGTAKSCIVRYPVIGRAKARTFRYEEYTDFTINWPGTFPFEFKRMYNSAMRNRLFPLFFGWTHNHNIRLIEDCQFDWIEDQYGDPDEDDEGLGIGRLWLCRPLGGEMFIGQYNGGATNEVVYEPVDKQNCRIIRTSSVTVNTTDSDWRDVAVTYVYEGPDGMEMTFQKAFTVKHYATDEGLVGWTVTAGIDKQEDRFGNYLEYTWNADEIRLEEISAWAKDGAGVTELPAHLDFTYDFDPFNIWGPSDPHLCGEITLDDSDVSTTYDAIIEFSAGIWATGITYGTQGPSPGGMVDIGAEYHYEMQNEFMLDEILRYDGGDDYDSIWIWVEYDNDDGTLTERTEGICNAVEGRDIRNPITEEYYCYYDGQGNSITTIYVKTGDNGGSGDVLLRREVTATTSEGILLSRNVTTYPAVSGGSTFDPYAYDDYSDRAHWIYGDIGRIGNHSGGGGALDTDYYYEDSDFPLKPTTIIECFDDDGDGDYDRPSRTTTLRYDDEDRGNVVEKRVYVDDTNFVYTEYEYHEVYDFPITQTTYQGYCYESGGNVQTSGSKVEKQWFYSSDADDAFDDAPDPRALTGDGDSGEYLVRERTLVGVSGGDQWAATFYSYIPGGRVKMKEDPVGESSVGSITYYEYDDEDGDDGYGFLEKEWHGVSLDQSGDPEGNPQKRYYHDDLGHKVLDADYLGKVQMNVCDSLGTVLQVRTYRDTNAMSKADAQFEADSYDSDIWVDDFSPQSGTFDTWQTRAKEDGYDHKRCGTLTTGAKTERYIVGRDIVQAYVIMDADNTLRGAHSYLLTASGRHLHDHATYRNDTDYDYAVICNLYNSMFRLAHKYTYYGYEEPPATTGEYNYIKHEVYQYGAEGNKTYEAVYSLTRGQSGFDTEDKVLEKSNSYEYDILGRLVKQVVDDTDEGLNQTTKYGYDAAGNRIYVVDPNGNVIFSDYDNANRKIREYFAVEPVYFSGTTDIDFEETKDDAVKKKEVAYYDNGKVESTVSYDYDGTSLLSGTKYTYDSRGRIEKVEELVEDTDTDDIMESTDEFVETSYDYADAGNLAVGGSSVYHIVTTDAEGKETGIQLSYHGKTQKIMYPSGDYEKYTYYDLDLDDDDCLFNDLLYQKSVWDGQTEEEITYAYDDYGKVSRITYPDTGYLDYTYTSRILGEYGKVAQITDHRTSADRPGSDGDTYDFDYWYPFGQVRSYKNHDDYTIYYHYSKAYDRQTNVQVTDNEDPPEVIYDLRYTYDLAGRLTDVDEYEGSWNQIADIEYDENGNRDTLTYHLDSTTPEIEYEYNLDNMLVKYSTTDGPTFDFYGTEGPSSDWAEVDGLGRLRSAEEELSLTPGTGGTATHIHIYDFDMRSQLTDATISGIDSKYWFGEYSYRKDGNLDNRRIRIAAPRTSGDLTMTSFAYLDDQGVGGDLTRTGRILDIDDNSDLVGYWKLDENADNTDVADSSAYGNDGTASKDTDEFHTDDAMIGTGAFDFDGSGDYVDLGTDDSLDLAGEEITLAAWINPAASGQTGYIVGKADTSNADRHYGMLLVSGSLHTYTDGFDSHNTSFTPTVGEWAFVAMTWDGTTKTAYADGSSLGTWSGTAITADSKSPLIGCRHNGAGVAYFFNGLIDDVMIISDALDADQIEAMYLGFEVSWDDNGNIATNDAANDIDYTFNWDNKLRKAIWNEDEDFIEIKYDPFGNRVWKRYTHGTDPVVVDEHKYIVDITGKLPVILMDLNQTDTSLKKKYIYADSQILAQHDIDEGEEDDFKYFYLHDRLGSVRLVIDDDGDVVSHYTYEPFGEMIDDDVTFANDFLFTGQYFDSEIEEYYLRARQYNPQIARFTSRDPVFGKLHQPLTLNRYLYCLNNPINLMDPSGESPWDWLSLDDYDWDIFDDGLSFEKLLNIHNNMENLPIPDYNTGEQIALMASMALADYLVPGVGTSVSLLMWAAEAGPYLERIGYMNVLHNAILETAIDAYDW